MTAGSESMSLENLFIMLASLEMIALTQTCAFVPFAIILPIQWLAGKHINLQRMFGQWLQ